jgi:alkylation response protein AidB-like acyl-CoA dehydrogenase
MRLEPDPATREFAVTVRELLASAADVDALRAAWDSPDGRVPGLGKRLAELGVVGLTVPEEFGGAGADLTTAVPVLVEAGRAALPEPLVETVTAVALFASAGGPFAAEWLPRLAAGDATPAVVVVPEPPASGVPVSGVPAPGAQWADVFLVVDRAGGTARVLTRDAVAVRPAAALDHGAGIALVDGVVDAGQGAGESLVGADVASAVDHAYVGAAAYLVGLSSAMLDLSVRHALQREQFGRPIGSFQAVKHQLADVYLANAFAAPVVHRAAWSVSRGLASGARDASHAKWAATRAAERAARTALQVHAAIGYTYEHELHLWLKRTWTLTTMWGDAHFHRDRVAADVLGDNPAPRVP